MSSQHNHTISVPGSDFSHLQTPTLAEVLPEDITVGGNGGGKGGKGGKSGKGKGKGKPDKPNDNGGDNPEEPTTPLQKAKALAKSVLLGCV